MVGSRRVASGQRHLLAILQNRSGPVKLCTVNLNDPTDTIDETSLKGIRDRRAATFSHCPCSGGSLWRARGLDCGGDRRLQDYSTIFDYLAIDRCYSAVDESAAHDSCDNYCSASVVHSFGCRAL
jgi:hypothetical protein